MTVEELAAELLVSTDDAERRGWLTAHRPAITRTLLEHLKAAAEQHMLSDPRRALEIAEVAREAASLAAPPDPVLTALAQWTLGNVLIYAGDFAACLEAYQAAEAVYAAQGDGLAVARLQGNRVFALVNLGRHAEALALAETARQGLAAAGQADSVYAATLAMNAGVAQRQSGDYAAALAAYERGRAIFEALGHVVQAARMDINRAKALEKLDRFREAAALLETARATLQEHGVTLDVARADLNRGYLAFRRGRYGEAVERYEQARAGFAALGNEMEEATVDYGLAQVYLALNLFAEAYEQADRSRQAFAGRGMTRYAIQATVWQAAAAWGLGRATEAATLFAQARAGLTERGEAIEVAILDLQRAALLAQDGQTQTALDTARSAAGVLERHGLSVRLAQARLTLADCLLAVGCVDEAAALYAAALDVAEREELPTLAYRARYGQGRAAESRGDDAAAADEYAAAIAHLETIHHGLRLDEFQASFRDDKLAVYEAAARLALRRGDVAAAFDMVEQSRAGALLDLLVLSVGEGLARGLEPLTAGDAADELLRRLQALREEWHWHVSRLDGYAPADEDQPDRADEVRLRETVRAIEGRLGEVWRQLRLRQPNPPAPFPTREGGGPPPRVGEGPGPWSGPVGAEEGWFPEARRLSLAEVQARLPADAALVEYYAVGDELLAFLARPDGADVVALGATVEEVEALVGAWRFDLDSLRLLRPELSPGRLAALETEGRDHLRRLYRALVAPLAGRLTACRQLIVAPHRAIHYLPLAVLHDGQGYLVERFETSYLPTASLLQALAPSGSVTRVLPSDLPSRPALILAHSDGGRLPHVLAEARQVADILAGAWLFVEEEATEARLREFGPACGLLHLATHGAFRSDNPLFSWLRLAGDARLTVRDVYGLRLPHAALVTLSACETGLGGLRGGDVLGLSQGFLAAGARALLLSLWAVDDASTAQLMAAFYRRLMAGEGRAAALRGAQLAVRGQYPHPFHWAGFVLVGASGRLAAEEQNIPKAALSGWERRSCSACQAAMAA